MDLHKKGVFSMSVSDLKEPPPEFRGEVNIEDIWKSVNLEMIAQGFVSSQTKNPFAVQPNYSRWAPWIGHKTRMDHSVLNTEFAKVATSKVTSAEAQMISVSEDRLVDELMKQKVGVVRKLCKACNIDSKGSCMDLISRLRAEMQNRQSYDKMFQKTWGALAIPFHPHEGRLAEPTPENISSANQGKLKVSLPWLFEKTDSSNAKGHPITGSSEQYVLYDKLHESNTKDPQDVLKM
ncbi:hypothetical protein QQF64_033901 [Cirrhinus molitorella]|uniref:Uncharacterized protein n=1 Tax=Cirrhinus molitorella TaxID=172907 RepID=A0ABR3MV67_9TELE